MNVEINFVAVLLAAVASMVVGFIWYNPMVLGKPWMKQKGYTPEGLKAEQAKMAKFYAISFVAALVTAYVLAHVSALSKNFFGLADIQTSLTTAFWMWLGFILPVQLSDQIFGEKKFVLLAINTGFQLVALLVMGLIIGWFGIK